MRRKSPKMREVEQRFGKPLEHLIVEGVEANGMAATAKELGVSKATFGYWMLKMTADVRRIVLLPGDELEVKRGEAWK